MVDMKVNIAGVEWNNPVCVVASGTFGFGREYGEYFDLNEAWRHQRQGINA